MVLYQLHMQREAAHDTIYKLGQLGCVQFRDMNANVIGFQRLFTNDVRRCEEMERKIRYFKDEVEKVPSLLTTVVDGTTTAETLDTLEPKLETLEFELKELTSKWKELLLQKNAMKEHLEILTQPPAFFRGEEDGIVAPSRGLLDEGDAGLRTSGLRYLTGVLSTDRIGLFERLVYRATRGNMFMRTALAGADFQDSKGKPISKTVFVVFFTAQRLQDKIKKLCDSLQAALYSYNIDDLSEVRNSTKRVQDTLTDLEATINGTESSRDNILYKVRENLFAWMKTVVIEKSVFNVLNNLSFKGQTVVAECWAPKEDVEQVSGALSAAEVTSGAQVQSFMEEISTPDQPPTFFKTNRFTSIHQSIVNAYGIARYKEVNPACFSVITFPFLFGVMYGDIGHGTLMLIVSLLFVWKEKEMLSQPLNELVEMVFVGRYVLVPMSLFAIYMGLLYNDFFGMMIQPFGDPFWKYPEAGQAAEICDPGFSKWFGYNASDIRGCRGKDVSPIVFGVDGNWCETENKLEFYNSLKMKMAVILGVVQMTWGIILSLFNHVYFGEHSHIWFMWLPEMVFLLGTFGYMDVMIIGKWCIDWSARMADNLSPPSLLETMTGFFLSPGSVEADKFIFVSAGFQNGIQILLLLCAVLAVPMMLIPIPLIEYRHMQHNYSTLDEPHKDSDAVEKHADGDEEKVDFSEIVIKQVIHTIEFVLGCVSNTASYLRLWALSLAHAQLSEVFWNFAWMMPLEMDHGSGIFVFVGWAVWGGATVGVLGIMESLSAFLHALRLHWVEFQNKFYYGDGSQFIPYDHSQLIPKSHMYFQSPDAN